jgi:Protein of unknown function (DUF2934)
MARKSTANTTPRAKKTSEPIEPVAVSPIPSQVTSEASLPAITASAGAKKTSVNLDDEIRRRAYELYLERKGMAGDPNRDWFIAEREVRSRYSTRRQHSA